MKALIGWLWMIGMNVAVANMQGSYEAGQELANGLLDQQKNIQSVDVPEFETDFETKSRWQRYQNTSDAQLNQHTRQAAEQDETAKTLIENEKKRDRFQDIGSSALLQHGTVLTRQSKEILGKDGRETRSLVLEDRDEPSVVECKAARAPELFSCIQYLKSPQVTVIPEKKTHYWCTSGAHGPDDLRCRAKRYYNPPLVYQQKKVIVSQEEWVNECESLASRVLKNECKVVEETCLDDKPRVINEETVNKACWKKQYTYSCQYPVKNHCHPYLAKGCNVIRSVCDFEHHGKCYIWRQTLQCPYQVKESILIDTGAPLFCLDGECFEPKQEENTEFFSSMAQFSIFGELQKDIAGGLKAFFRGEDCRCSKHMLSFKNCCGGSGWGKELKLAGCSESENLLMKKREQGLCHEVGEFCAHKVLGQCRRKDKSYCCYRSKLLRLIHEQGRAQLGIGWGDGKNPNCRGLTTEEIAQIDFSQLDLSEYFNEIKGKFKPEDQNRIMTRVQQHFERLQQGEKQEKKRNV